MHLSIRINTAYIRSDFKIVGGYMNFNMYIVFAFLVSAQTASAMSMAYYCVNEHGARALQFEGLPGRTKIFNAWDASNRRSTEEACTRLTPQGEFNFRGEDFEVNFQKSPSGKKITSAKIIWGSGRVDNEIVCYPSLQRDEKDCLRNPVPTRVSSTNN